MRETVCSGKYGKSSSEEIRELYTIQFTFAAMPVEANDFVGVHGVYPGEKYPRKSFAVIDGLDS